MILYSAIYGGGHPFDELPFIEKTLAVEHPDELDAPGILVIWGGEDISPTLYNKAVSSYTHATHRISRRDAIEAALCKKAIEKDIPIIGVCRGAQLLCALAGGHLIQHVTHHGGRHMVELKGGGMVMTNSIHHQMMYPFNVEHEMRGWISRHLSGVHVDVSDDGLEFINGLDANQPEPEYVYFPKIKGFAIQWHPEGMASTSEANKFLLKDIEQEISKWKD